MQNCQDNSNNYHFVIALRSGNFGPGHKILYDKLLLTDL